MLSAVCKAFGWQRATDNRRREAPGFYERYTALVVQGAAVVLFRGAPLFPPMGLSQALNSILLSMLLVLLMRLANDGRLIGKHYYGRVGTVRDWGMAKLILPIPAGRIIVSRS